MASAIKICAYLTLALGAAAPALAAGKPRVASIDFCADQYALAFADRADLLAVSEDGASPHSYYRDRAVGLPIMKGNAEQILTLKPELVLRSWRGSLATDALMARTGISAYQPPYAFDYEGVLRNAEAAATVLGHAGRGRAWADDHRARYDALQEAEPYNLRAVYLTPSGFTAGKGSSVDDVIRLAGFTPAAEALGIRGWGELPLEKLVMSPPDVVIGSFFDDDAVHISSWSSGRHGVFWDIIKDRPAIMVPSSLMSCGSSMAVEAAEFIRAEAARLGLVPEQKGSLSR